MTTPSLLEWQARLAKHFAALAERRRQTDWPVFALEHGLTGDEVRQLESAVRSSLLVRLPRATEYLPWVVYAAEFGYLYAGEEYWQSFAAETPGWNQGWHHLIKDFFIQFAGRYHGAKPEGVWARRFNIIAWPITHGVLPKDLQRQLVRVLWDARYGLRPELFSSAAMLGEYLRELSDDASARFQQFAENTLLLGQIAAALLVQEPGEEQLLSAPTLDRLTADINAERASREWLTEARSTAQRLRVRGLSARESPLSSPGGRASTESAGAVRPAQAGTAAEPRFLLRPGSAGKWDVVLEIPDLAPLLRVSARARAVLERSQGHLAGSAGRVIARGRLIGNGAQRFVLTSWPAPDKALISFDDAPPELRLLLDSGFRTPPGDSWLFRVAGDGQAHSLKTRQVHPAESYVLLQRQPVGNPTKGFEKLTLNCEGVHALRFEVPTHVDELWETLLANLHLECIKTLKVRPVGVLPSSWDEAGHAEWLVGDEPILGIEVDHPIRSIRISVDEHSSETFPVAVGQNGGELFVSLGQLGEGSHRAVIQTVRQPDRVDEIRGFLDIRVRRPRSKKSGRSAQQALLLTTFPSSPTLEDLWDDRLELQLSGPTGLPVRCTAKLLDRRSGAVLFKKTLPSQQLPIEPAAWRKVLEERIRKDKDAELAYDASNQCQVEFDGGSLGRVTLTAERECTPLRWGLQRGGDTPLVKLFDDSGAPGVTVVFRNIRSPDVDVSLGYDDVVQGIPLAFPGGLFIASSKDEMASAVLVPPAKRLQFDDLLIRPRVAPIERQSSALSRVLRVASEWETAHLKGSAPRSAYRADVVRTIMAELFGTICGERWMRAERRYASDAAGAVRQMKLLISDHPSERSLGAAIEHDAAQLAHQESEDKIACFSRLVRTYVNEMRPGPAAQHANSFVESFTQQKATLIQAEELCAFALRAASSPSGLLKWCSGDPNDGLTRILERPVVARAARFAVLVVDHRLSSEGIDSGTAYTGWAW